jgi:hypothetical protein
MALYSFDTDAGTITCDGEPVGTDDGIAAVAALTRIVVDAAANAEAAVFERVLGEPEAERIREADNAASRA